MQGRKSGTESIRGHPGASSVPRPRAPCYCAGHFARHGDGTRAGRTSSDEEERLTELPPRRSFFPLFILFWAPVLLYVSVIFALSAQPNLTPPLNFENSDKFFHMLEYGGLGFLFSRALRASARIRRALRVALIVVAVGAVIAMSDEIFQSFIPGRDSSATDWMADVTGLLFAQVFYLMFTHD